MISVKEQAIRLAMRGIPVFPCTQNKRPAFKGWVLDATTDVELVSMRHWEEYLIGIPTGPASGIAVIDIDPDNGGHEWLKVNAKNFQTRSHRTRSDGVHLLFRVTDGSVRNSQSRIAPGVDVRGDGGLFIWWPAHGGQVLDYLPLNELPDFPAWLIPERRKPVVIKTGPILANRYRVTSLIKFMRESHPGERNSRLFWAACRLAELKFTEAEQRANAVNKLLKAAVGTGLDGEEAQKTIESAFTI